MMHKILLVEDEPNIARFVELELSHEGYEVTKAEDGREGLKLAEEGRFDLVLLDIMLPVMDAPIPERLHGVLLHVVAAHIHPAAVHVVQPGDHAHQRGLGAAGAA